MKRILVIDDDVNMRELVVEILGDLDGVEVISASDGREALAIPCSEEFSLVITDMNMPGIDGIEVIRRIRQDRPQVKIMAMSGADKIETRDALLKVADLMGVSDSFEKLAIIKDSAAFLERVEALLGGFTST